MYKEVVYESETVEFELEAIDHLTVALHIEVKKFNRAAYIEWQEFIADTVIALRDMGKRFFIAPVNPNDEITRKLAIKFGFMPTGITTDGRVEVFTWAL